ncbi:hypothetical protein HID58_073058 [Brassica napus]|uniref:Uncharacterized protein n=1 Tax=Brassica napus TaxID=3708 RepID=A0ABQ7Z6A7_BRANA|nr:hypothetical protein HID58_073058 [Brassica napus]
MAWDCSAWDRTYTLFLEERHECYYVLKGRAFGRSLRCSFQGDNNPGYDIHGTFMLITLLYGSCTGDDNNREYDRPEARASQLPVLGWLLLEMQKDQQPLTVSSVLNLCMVQMFRRKGAMAKSHARLSFPA